MMMMAAVAMMMVLMLLLLLMMMMMKMTMMMMMVLMMLLMMVMLLLMMMLMLMMMSMMMIEAHTCGVLLIHRGGTITLLHLPLLLPPPCRCRRCNRLRLQHVHLAPSALHQAHCPSSATGRRPSVTEMC